ncbi:MAG: type II toxin-antitoxin system Phd/YefM family antitoxin [Actinomycetes bacterium]
MQVGVRELKNNLSRYLARVTAGDEVVVTDRGRPIARISPLTAKSTLDRLVAEGVITPAPEAKRRAPRSRIQARRPVSDLVADQRR